MELVWLGWVFFRFVFFNYLPFRAIWSFQREAWEGGGGPLFILPHQHRCFAVILMWTPSALNYSRLTWNNGHWLFSCRTENSRLQIYGCYHQHVHFLKGEERLLVEIVLIFPGSALILVKLHGLSCPSARVCLQIIFGKWSVKQSVIFFFLVPFAF